MIYRCTYPPQKWFYPTSISTVQGIVGQNGPSANPGYNGTANGASGWSLCENGGVLQGGFLYGFGFSVFNGTTAINGSTGTGTEAISTLYASDVWWHVVGVYDGTNVILYVNGTNNVTSVPMAGTLAPDSWDPITIGCMQGLSNNRFGGSIDEVAIYTNALTPAQVGNHYNAGTNASPGSPYSTVVLNDHPLTYWRMDAPNYDFSVWNPTTLPGAANYGSIGSAVNGFYQPATFPGLTGPALPVSVAIRNSPSGSTG